jgi:hypothetical protein
MAVALEEDSPSDKRSSSLSLSKEGGPPAGEQTTTTLPEASINSLPPEIFGDIVHRSLGDSAYLTNLPTWAALLGTSRMFRKAVLTIFGYSPDDKLHLTQQEAFYILCTLEGAKATRRCPQDLMCNLLKLPYCPKHVIKMILQDYLKSKWASERIKTILFLGLVSLFYACTNMHLRIMKMSPEFMLYFHVFDENYSNKEAPHWLEDNLEISFGTCELAPFSILVPLFLLISNESEYLSLFKIVLEYIFKSLYEERV